MSFNKKDDVQTKFWNHLRNEAYKQRIPIQGHFELTPQCNLDCKMCYVHLTKQQMNGQKEISLNDWLKIIDGAIDNGMIFASLTGGECLTSPYFKDIYLYLQSKGIIVNVLTNGILLDTMIDFFNEHPPRLIQVSIYGNNEDDYERVTGKRVWQKVTSNVDKAISSNLNISIAVTPSKYFTNVAPIIEKYKNLGISVGVNEYLIQPNENTGRNISNFNLTMEENLNISLELKKINNEEINPLCDDDMVSINTQTLDPFKEQKGINCVAGMSDFTINWKGEMLMCSSLKEITGYPLQEDFKVSWRKTNEKAENFAMPIECFNCDYYKFCTHCPANHLVNAKQGHCNINICEYMKKTVKLGIYKL